ncbi:hypothetical protein QVD17_30974 [Tagetes erecta]|uniref:Uncharacterized protein n=1 Tax=Tagetes erecta TaxID=13708 RepID=A0AAD8NNS5_TARER|nr:hypothetical protein QVD17_30974 [Tagetes erecta]
MTSSPVVAAATLPVSKHDLENDIQTKPLMVSPFKVILPENVEYPKENPAPAQASATHANNRTNPLADVVVSRHTTIVEENNID